MLELFKKIFHLKPHNIPGVNYHYALFFRISKNGKLKEKNLKEMEKIFLNITMVISFGKFNSYLKIISHSSSFVGSFETV